MPTLYLLRFPPNLTSQKGVRKHLLDTHAHLPTSCRKGTKGIASSRSCPSGMLNDSNFPTYCLASEGSSLRSVEVGRGRDNKAVIFRRLGGLTSSGFDPSVNCETQYRNQWVVSQGSEGKVTRARVQCFSCLPEDIFPTY